MTIRDSRKTPAYFDAHIRFNADAIHEFRAELDQPSDDPRHRARLLHAIFRKELDQLVSLYSSGGSLAAMSTAYPRVITALAEYQSEAGRAAHDFGQFDAYVFALWIFSLGILLDVGDDQLVLAASELGNEGRDALFDRLVALRLPRQTSARELRYADPYEPLYEALDATGERRTASILQFLAKYYDGMQSAYWHGSHLGDNLGYFGYWSFELAAFVQELGIDDRSFTDNPFYPRDLVRQRASR